MSESKFKPPKVLPKQFSNDFATYFVVEFWTTLVNRYVIVRFHHKDRTLERVGALDKYGKAKALRLAHYWSVIDGKKPESEKVKVDLKKNQALSHEQIIKAVI